MIINEEINQLENKMNELQTIQYELREDYKRTNKHRKAHKAGTQDRHTKYKPITDHIDDLNDILKRILKDIADINQEINKTYYRLQTLYMYSDADEDMKTDAEQSYREVMEELTVH